MNFEFHNPTRLIFGAGNLSRLGQVVSTQGKRALLVTGGGSVRRSGTFDRAVASLNGADVSVVECAGVEPNPRITSVARGAQIAREENCDIVIALGGGSTMDASKVIAAALYYDGDPWDMIMHGQKKLHVPTQALPIVTVPTLAATGSEMNCGAVNSNEETYTKSFIMNDILYPYAAVVDPELTISVPKDQTAYSGAASALFDKIGPGVLITHSHSGGMGWDCVIKNPNIRAVVSYEPGSGFIFPEGEVPPPMPSSADTLKASSVPLSDFMKLTKIPIVIYYGDNIPEKSSDNPGQDNWRVRLAMAKLWVDAINRHGGDATVVHLPEIGIHGNTHFPFSDLNNIEIAGLLSGWLEKKGLD
jgi:hypothetical protein